MSWNIHFHPKLLDCLRDYSKRDFLSDLAAGITVGIVALPLAMAFGIASGVTPQAGIFTAVIAGFLISALGGSRVQIGGPTGAFIVIVYGIVAQYGLDNLFICTMMAGVILMIMGFAGLGTVIKYIPLPVTLGFTNGIAVLIFSTQIKDFFGVQLDAVPSAFIPKMEALALALPTINPATVLLAIGSLLVIVFWPVKWRKAVPGSIVALVAGTLIATGFHLPVETIGTRFHDIPQGLPPFHVPAINWSGIENLIRPATTIALLAAIESLLSAVVADGMIDDRHDSNQELIAQGLANFASPFFGGVPATGAIARTATNVRSGAVSPIAGVIHAATLLVIILVAAPLAKYIPLATLSAVLMIVAFNMGEWQEFALMPKYPKGDAVVFLTTFGLTVVFDLTIAVEIGMILAAFLFIQRVAETTKVSLVDEATDMEGDQHSMRGKDVPPGVLVFSVFGALMFGAAEKLENLLLHSRQEPKVLILRMQKVLAMDSTALHTLEHLQEKLSKRGIRLILSGPHTQPYTLMINSGFLDRLGDDNIAADLDDALAKARTGLDAPAA